MTNVQTKTLRGLSVTPSLTVDDLNRSSDFFTGLGFEIEDFDVKEPSGFLLTISSPAKKP